MRLLPWWRGSAQVKEAFAKGGQQAHAWPVLIRALPMPPRALPIFERPKATVSASGVFYLKLFWARVRQAFLAVDAALLRIPLAGVLASVVLRCVLLLAAFALVRRVLLERPLTARLGRREYVPGRHVWTSAPVALPPNFCNVCAKATTGLGDVIARCEICGCYCHASCTRKAVQVGLLCKATCRQDIEVAAASEGKVSAYVGVRAGLARYAKNKRRSLAKLAPSLAPNAEKDADAEKDVATAAVAAPAELTDAARRLAAKFGSAQEEDAENAKAEPKTVPHQWFRGNIDQLQPCGHCGLFCGSDGLFGLHGYSCVYCGVQVHEGCLQPMLTQECSLGRHRGVIIPPTAVERIISQSSKKQKLLDAVKRVLPLNDAANDTTSSSAPFPLLNDQSGESRHSFIDGEWAESMQDAAAATTRDEEQERNASVSRNLNLTGRPVSERDRGLLGSSAPVTASALSAATRMDVWREENDQQKDQQASGGHASIAESRKKQQQQQQTASQQFDGDLLAGLRPLAAGGSAAKFNFRPELIPEDVTPLLVFVNSRSGGRQGAALLSRFRSLLNPIQVADLFCEDPTTVLERFRSVPRLRLLACGGDGTVAWVLKAVDSVQWHNDEPPPLAIMPLGTGNDLARILGWGGGETQDPADVLDSVEASEVTRIDRWSVSVTPLSPSKGNKHERSLVMNNYLGVGIDGQVALDFHRMRESYRKLFVNRLINKAWYATLGATEILTRRCKNLPDKLELFCDGQRVALPPSSESLIVLNIDSYAGGAKLWSVEEGEEERSRPPAKRGSAAAPAPAPSTRSWWLFGETADADATRKKFYQPTSSSAASSEDSSSSPSSGTSTSRSGSGYSADNSESAQYSSFASSSAGSSEFEPSGAEQQQAQLQQQQQQQQGGLSADAAGVAAAALGEMFQTLKYNVGAAAAAAGAAAAAAAAAARPKSAEEEQKSAGPASSNINDGMLEVCAVAGAWHLGQIQVGLSRGLLVAQSRDVRIRTKTSLPMQVDGEPWQQPPSDVRLKRHEQAVMLRPAPSAGETAAQLLQEVLRTCEKRGVISRKQAREVVAALNRKTRSM